MDSSREQLAFWPLVEQGQSILSDDWTVARPTVEFDSTLADDIFLSGWGATEDEHSTRDMVLIVGSLDWGGAVRIAVAPRHNLPRLWLTADWTSNKDRHSVAGLFIRAVQSGKTQTRTRSLASSLRRISQEAVRQELTQALTKVMYRTHDESEEVLETSTVPDKHFMPSKTLVEMVRDGFQSYSANYSRLVEPRFLPVGAALLKDEDISDFIVNRVWRLVLSSADRAAAEGKDLLQLGNSDGFLDQFDHLLLDRIPVSPKNVTQFLRDLYLEYSRFTAHERKLPGRGTLWSDANGLFCKLDTLSMEAPTAEANTRKTEVLFE
jgi:hypothetical protein